MSASAKQKKVATNPRPPKSVSAPASAAREALDLRLALSRIIYEDDDCFVRYRGLEEIGASVIVTFPDLIHPTSVDAPGWGEPLFLKRGRSVISILQKKTNWFQNPGFFSAMARIREFVGPKVDLICYGGSMGGYGAILGAGALAATKVVAYCPQFSVDRSVTPFERRYTTQAAEIGTFIWDVGDHYSASTQYLILYDPTHKVDRRHRALFPAKENWITIPVPGSSHGTLPTLIEMGLSQQLFDLTVGTMTPIEMRQAIRKRRTTSYRYIRRMGNLSYLRHPRLHGLFRSIAEERGYKKLQKKWASSATKLSSEVIVHAGQPETGTTAIQSWLSANPTHLESAQVLFPREPHERYQLGQTWLSTGLINGDFDRLRAALNAAGQNSQRLLLSDESIYLVSSETKPDVARRLRALLEGCDVSLILCERDLGSWKKSFYLQSIRNRRSKSTHRSAQLWGTSLLHERFFQNPYVKSLCDYEAVAQKLANLFGATRVTRIKMSPEKDIIPDFLGAVGMSGSSLQGEVRRNPSLSDVDGEILRQANAMGVREAGFIKKLLLAGTETPTIRNPKRASELRSIALGFSWSAFHFQENPPLALTEELFAARLESLHRTADFLINTGRS